MRLPSGKSHSVRGIIAAGLAALALLCFAVAAGVGWVAAQLQSTSSALVRDAESLRLITQVELQLLDYQRLAVFQDDPASVAQRRVVRQELDRTLEQALAFAADANEEELIRQVTADIADYIDRRRALEQQGLEPYRVQQGVRAVLNTVLMDLDVLMDMNRNEVAAAYGRAQQVGAFFIVVAVLTAVLTIALLLIAVWATRRMLLQPILGLRETIDRFRAGQPSAIADEQAPRELSEIAKAFNDMSLELRRQQAQQLAFIAGVAHDLRNPLTALQYGIDAIKTRGAQHDNDHESRETLALVGRQLDHLARMADDLLETCAVESGQLVLQPSRFDLRDAARAVVELYRPAAPSRDLRLRVDDRPVTVRADRTRIEQVIGNLLSNAIKYSPADSSITIDVTSGDGCAQLAVTDHGVGIAPQDLEDVFRPFWRARSSGGSGGTGLGLSVVQKIVAAHGGTIHVDSEPGFGSVFRLDLPATEAEPQTVEPLA